MDSVRTRLSCERRPVLCGLGHSGFYISIRPFLIVVDTPICLPQVHSLFWITLSRLSVCLAQKNVDFLDFFASRNGPMIVFWPMKSKWKLLGEILLFSLKSQHVLPALFFSLSCLEYGHSVWKFSISLVMMRTGATFREFWKL